MNTTIVKNSFLKAKQHITANQQRIEQLELENSSLKNRLQELEERLSNVGTIGEPAAIAEETTHKIENNIKDALREVVKEMDERIVVRPTENTITTPVSFDMTQFNKKTMVKKNIKEIASQQDMTLAQLKWIIVNQKGYCSKASFYRYIDELKKEEQFSIA